MARGPSMYCMYYCNDYQLYVLVLVLVFVLVLVLLLVRAQSGVVAAAPLRHLGACLFVLPRCRERFGRVFFFNK